MGDLGILAPEDVLIAISNSGETNEVIHVVRAARKIGTPSIAMTRNPESTLARECDDQLPIVVDREVGALGLPLQYLNTSTYYSVSTQIFHFSVTPSQCTVVQEY